MNQNKSKIAFDCNIIASVLLGGITRSRFLELLTFRHQLEFYNCSELEIEIKKLSSIPYFTKKGISKEVVEKFVEQFGKISMKVDLVSSYKINRDPKDNYLLNLCADARLDYLITGDKDLLSMKTFESTRILTLADFMSSFLFTPF